MDDNNTRIEDDDIKCLELFITENDALEELETIANEFDIFTSLGIQHFEIRHSIFLSWIFFQ